ncbi:MAG: nitrate reductase subunit beta [Bacteroidaceae bacterium]|nr:nitrate reductase subunit beta [Bacteroidaceae bacterium]
MKIKAQINMVLNLDKCIGCHTCSVTCKNVWTSRKGLEYAWFNNVETKPGPGYPKRWEDQEKYKGGWKLDKERLNLRLGNRLKIMSQIFSNPYLPQVEDYYEPFSFNFSTLKGKKRVDTPPSARPYSLVTGEKMKKIEGGPNWEDDMAGTFDQRKTDPNLDGLDTSGYEAFEQSFMFYVPRLCEHCLHPACVASCPSGAIYKRPDDGAVVINQDRCRGWRECVSACPYKKIYFNYDRMKSEKCIFCYPRIEDGQPTACAESCVGRMRYFGVILYDAEKIDEYSASSLDQLYQKQLSMILDPFDPAIIKAAEEQGISHNYIMAAQKSPTYKLMKEWQIAFPLHPEYRTLPMVWYVPPMSPKKSMDDASDTSYFAQVDEMRIPVGYLARLLAAGDEKPIRTALARMLALRGYMREKVVEGQQQPVVPAELGLTANQYDDMYRLLAIADFEDRFVIPSSPKQKGKHFFDDRVGLGFEDETNKKNLWGGR